MGSRKLASRVALLVLWGIGIFALLEDREPGFWREILSDGLPGYPRAIRSVPGPAAPRSLSGETGPGPVSPAPELAFDVPALSAPEPDPLWPRVRAAWRLNGERRYREAWLVARTLPASDEPRIRRLRALTALWAGHPEIAEPLLEAWLRRDPKSVEARLHLAEAQITLGRRNRARRVLAGFEGRTLSVRDWREVAARMDWIGDSSGAARAYRAALAEDPDDVPALAGLARVLEAQDQRAPAARAVERGLRLDPADPILLDVAAKLALARDEPADAAGYLERLGRIRPLTEDEELRLAGALRASGRDAEAFVLYRALLARAEAASPRDGLRIGDLRLAVCDFEGALAAYGTAGSPADGTDVGLRRAGAAARLGDTGLAARTYERYLAAHPGDLDARLEAARFHVNAGRPEASLGEYTRVIELRGPRGLRVELARALLAAGRYPAAETSARAAIAEDEDGPEARLALAQAVRLQGRTREGTELLEDARRAGEAQGLGASFAARVAAASGHHLEAYRIAAAGLDAGTRIPDGGQCGPAGKADAEIADLHMTAGAAALERGDLARAATAFEQASSLGAPLQSRAALERLREKSVSKITPRFLFFRDANGIELLGGMVTASLRPIPAFRLGLRAMAEVLSQDEARFTRTGIEASVDDLFLRPDLLLRGAFGFENASAGGGHLFTGEAELRKYFEGGSQAGVHGYRVSLLSDHEDLDPRLFNRIIDLETVGPTFALNGGVAYVDTLLRDEAEDHLRVVGGAEGYEDGNFRGLVYAHYQLPVDLRPGRWTVVRPNAFFEAFEHPDDPGYFSPSTHATVGFAGHTIRSYGRWEVQAELNPQLLVTEGTAGFGAYGLLDVGTDVGPVNLGVSGFAFYDGIDDYWLTRATARVVVAF